LSLDERQGEIVTELVGETVHRFNRRADVGHAEQREQLPARKSQPPEARGDIGKLPEDRSPSVL